MVLLQSSHKKISPDIVLCYGYTAAGTWKTHFWWCGVSLHYRHCRVNMIAWFGALCLRSFLLQIQPNSMYLNMATLLAWGIFTEKKRGNQKIVGCEWAVKDGIWHPQGYQGILTCFPEGFIPLIHFNFPPSDFMAWRLVQKVLQQCYQFFSFRILLKRITLEPR